MEPVSAIDCARFDTREDAICTREPMLFADVCGASEFAHTPVLWPELVAALGTLHPYLLGGFPATASPRIRSLT